jgi:hypothetical protein
MSSNISRNSDGLDGYSQAELSQILSRIPGKITEYQAKNNEAKVKYYKKLQAKVMSRLSSFDESKEETITSLNDFDIKKWHNGIYTIPQIKAYRELVQQKISQKALQNDEEGVTYYSSFLQAMDEQIENNSRSPPYLFRASYKELKETNLSTPITSNLLGGSLRSSKKGSIVSFQVPDEKTEIDEEKKISDDPLFARFIGGDRKTSLQDLLQQQSINVRDVFTPLENEQISKFISLDQANQMVQQAVQQAVKDALNTKSSDASQTKSSDASQTKTSDASQTKSSDASQTKSSIMPKTTSIMQKMMWTFYFLFMVYFVLIQYMEHKKRDPKGFLGLQWIGDGYGGGYWWDRSLGPPPM